MLVLLIFHSTLRFFAANRGLFFALAVATVSKIAPDFVGLLWAGVVNATIPKTHMRADWQYNWSARRWESCEDADQVIVVGTHVLFDVTQYVGNGIGKGNGPPSIQQPARV